MKFKKAFSFILCLSLLLGVCSTQLVMGIAEPECTCRIEVHGSNCPLSRCTCSWKDNHYDLNRSVDDHDEGCPLYGMSREALMCVCEADVHAKGCPRYVEKSDAGFGVALADGYVEDEITEREESEVEETTIEETVPETVDEESTGYEEIEPSGDSIVEETGDNEENESEKITNVEETETGEEDGEDVSLDPENSEPSADAKIDPNWQYPIGWEGYADGKMQGNLLIAEKAFSMPSLLNSQVNRVSDLLSTEHSVKVVDTEDNFAEVLSVYALLTGQTNNYPYDVIIDDGAFDSVYWGMTQITGVSNNDESIVHIKRLTATEAAEIYKLDAEQVRVLDELTAKNDIVREAVEKSVFSSLSETELTQVSGMVSKSLSPERRAVLLAALSLNGKVDYFWGGKSLAYGWDDRWGELRVVSDEGSDTYGTTRPLGLDCSGFVSWAFINAFGPDYGTYSSSEWNEVAPHIAWNQAKPGDVALKKGHVGIVLTADENGPTSYIHCSSGGVSITNNIGTFEWIVRPVSLGD